MCFSSAPPPTTPDPAPAPPPPTLAAEEQRIGSTRQRENKANFGSPDGPTTRVDRPTDTAAGKAGVNTNM